MENIDFRHDDKATDWALGTERAKVFSVTKTVPNPDFGKPLPGDYDEGVSAPLDDRETIEATIDYTMPATPNPGLALRYLKLARQNVDLAASWLMELALGTEGYDALADELAAEPDPDKAQALVKQITQSISKRALGGLAGKA